MKAPPKNNAQCHLLTKKVSLYLWTTTLTYFAASLPLILKSIIIHILNNQAGPIQYVPPSSASSFGKLIISIPLIRWYTCFHAQGSEKLPLTAEVLKWPMIDGFRKSLQFRVWVTLHSVPSTNHHNSSLQTSQEGLRERPTRNPTSAFNGVLFMPWSKITTSLKTGTLVSNETRIGNILETAAYSQLNT
jgi:hypothetical protein